MDWGILLFLWIGVMGGIVLFTGYSMKAKGQIKVGWFIGRDIAAERCRDIKGFIRAVYPKTMIFGTISVAGAVILVLMSAFDISYLAQLVLLLVIIIGFFWFNHVLKKATKEYLD